MDRKLTNGSLNSALLLALALIGATPLAAQVPVDENGEPLTAIDHGAYEPSIPPGADIEDVLAVSPAELQELVGRVALYPDDLLAIVLPASTYPLQIVQAARFLEALETDDNLEPDEDWDESVVALLNYPEVIRMMDADIDWTWRLGEAVIAQQSEIIAAVETFRDRAYAAGNLETDEYQEVVADEGVISIEPLDDEIIYVPYYEPEEVVVYQPRRVYNYYPDPYPVYYYPYPVSHSFSSGYFWGVTTAYSIGWRNRHLSVYHPTYWGHPYYGRFYYGHYYRQPSISVYNTWYVNNNYRRPTYRQRDGDYWRPRNRVSGARPHTQRVRNEYRPPGRTDRRPDERSDRRGRTDTQANVRQRDNRNNSGYSADGNSRNDRVNDRANDRQGRNRTTTAGNRRPADAAGGRGAAQNSRNDTRNATQATRRQQTVRSNTSDTAIRFRDRGNTEANTRSTRQTRAVSDASASGRATQRTGNRNTARQASNASNRSRPATTANRPANRTASAAANRANSNRGANRAASNRTTTRAATTRAAARPAATTARPAASNTGNRAGNRSNNAARAASRPNAATNRAATGQRANGNRQASSRNTASGNSRQSGSQRNQGNRRGNNRPRNRQ